MPSPDQLLGLRLSSVLVSTQAGKSWRICIWWEIKGSAGDQLGEARLHLPGSA